MVVENKPITAKIYSPTIRFFIIEDFREVFGTLAISFGSKTVKFGDFNCAPLSIPASEAPVNVSCKFPLCTVRKCTGVNVRLQALGRGLWVAEC